MKRTPIRPRRREPRRRPAPRWSAPDWETANMVLSIRAEGGCEICGRSDAIERHHRKRRRDGGDRYCNVVWLCPEHHQYVTEHPAEARRYGWIVSVNRDPMEVPFLWRRREWVYLDDYGNKTPLGLELADAHEHEGTPAV